jgi:O-antigen ligase
MSFCAFLGAGVVQLVPVPLAMVAAVSPEATRIIPYVDLALATGNATRHPFSIEPRLTDVGLVLFVANAMLLLGCARLFSIRGARRLVEAITCLGVALALAAIIQKPFFAGKIYGFWTPLEGGGPFGPFVNRNHFAGWMLMAVPLTLSLICGDSTTVMREVKTSWRDRLLWMSSPEASRLTLCAAAAFVMALSLVMTMSKSGIVALVLAVAMTGAVVMRRHRTTRRTLVLGYLLLLAIVAIGWAGIDAIASQFAATDWRDLGARRGAWADATDVASRFPVVGTGFNTYGIAMVFYQRHELPKVFTKAHNDYLQLAAEGGLLLMIPAIAAATAFAGAVSRRFSEDTDLRAYWLRVGAVTSITAVALQETVDFSLQMPGNAALFAVVCAIALHKRTGLHGDPVRRISRARASLSPLRRPASGRP